MNEQDVGLLLNNNALLYREYFEQAVSLIGIYVIYRAPIDGKKYDGYGEFDEYFLPPVKVGCIFVDDHPTQHTMKKLGWVAELQENSSIIRLPYDLPNLQVGGIVIVPSGIDNSEGRVFRITSMSAQMIYPSTIDCVIAPEYKSSMESEELNHKDNNFSILIQDEEFINGD